MKKVFKVLVILVFLFYANSVLAVSRDDKSSKTPVTIQGKTFYAGVEVEFNDHSRVGFIGDIDITYDESSNMIISKVKRSQINNVIESGDSNVYLNIELNIDYHDFQSDEYSVFSNENGSTFWFDQIANDNKKSYLEFLSTAVEVYGGIPYEVTSPGIHALYKGDLYQKGPAGSFVLSDFDWQEKEVWLKNIRFRFSIDEDVKADMKNIDTVDVGEVNEGSVHQDNISINNFYQIVDNTKKTLMSLSMYDKDGNPIEVNDGDMVMKVDDSNNVETIANYFVDNDASKLHVLTFEYTKEFIGRASVRVYVDDILDHEETVFVYYFNQVTNKMEIISEDLIINDDGYVTFDVSHFSEYVVASSNNKLVSNDTDMDEVTTGNTNIKDVSDYIIYIIICIVVILIIVVLFIRKKKTVKEIDVFQDVVDKNSVNLENNDIENQLEDISQDHQESNDIQLEQSQKEDKIEKE